MAKCYNNGVSRRGNRIWGSWTVMFNLEDTIVQYCRKAFRNKYKDMWIDPIYFDDKYFNYVNDFFSEVGVQLYPKISNIKIELQKRGYTTPKPLNKCRNQAERDKVKEEWDKYKEIVWEIIHSDIRENIEKGVQPINVIVTGTRYLDNAGEYQNTIKSVKEVTDF